MADPYSNRALRRHHLNRLKVRAIHIFVTRNGDGMANWKGVPDIDRSNDRKMRALKRANTMTICSCFMCGNPRRHTKGHDLRTLQERRARLITE